MHTGTKTFSDRAVAIEQQLLRKQAQVIAEIREYPAPITACDAQFNYLLEQRSTIPQELRRLRSIVDSDRSQAEKAAALARFESENPT